MNFSYRLKSLREDNDLTQSELARILKVSRETISGYENAGKEPNFELLVQIADYFDVSLDYLLCRTRKNIPFRENNKY